SQGPPARACRAPGPRRSPGENQDRRGEPGNRLETSRAGAPEVDRVRRRRGRSPGPAAVPAWPPGTIAQSTIQTWNDKDAAPRRAFRFVYPLHAVLAGMSGRMLRPDERRTLRRYLRILRRLRQVRPNLPRERVHRDGG